MLILPTECSRKSLLLGRVVEASEVYLQTVTDLTHLAGHKKGSEFSELLETARRQHKNCQRARNELKRHLAEHRC
jgi:hypothetical protein